MNTDEREQKARDADPVIQKANQPAALLDYAQRIALNLCLAHYPDVTGRWKPYGDLFGVLEQIDNMTTQLVRGTPEQLAVLEARRARVSTMAPGTSSPAPARAARRFRGKKAGT